MVAREGSAAVPGDPDRLAPLSRPESWLPAATLAASLAFLLLAAARHGARRRRLRGRGLEDEAMRREDSALAFETLDASDASDSAERGRDAPAPHLDSTRPPKRGGVPPSEASPRFASTTLGSSLASRVAALDASRVRAALRLADLALVALAAWGVMFVGHDRLCGAVMRCECSFPWMGGWARCNAHNLHGGPRCPWCAAPYWTSVLTQKSCAAVVVAAYALGAGGGPPEEDESSESGEGNLDAEDASESDHHGRGGSRRVFLPALSLAAKPFARRDASSSRADDADGETGLDREPGWRFEARLAARRFRALGLNPARAAGSYYGRFLAPLAWWFALEMFWQASFYLALGLRQSPAYPCFVVCWGDPAGFGNNPPSPLSLADAPPMQRLYRDAFGETGGG